MSRDNLDAAEGAYFAKGLSSTEYSRSPAYSSK